MLERVGQVGLLGVLGLGLLSGCASNQVVVELSASIMHEKPRIREVSHVLTDRRAEGGAATLRITLLGDPGLSATFDISPGIAKREPMREAEDGNYTGEFEFPPGQAGGPFTIIGRLQHEAAGEITFRDPDPLTLPLIDRRR